MLTGDYVPPPELADQARSPIKETLQRFKRPVRHTGAKAMPVKARGAALDASHGTKTPGSQRW